MNFKLKISAVSYLNTLPFIYAIDKYFKLPYQLSLDYPSICAEKLKTGSVDLALVPVAVIPELKNCSVVTSYCIGADGAVASVMLYSQVSLEQIDAVYLDYQSMTSVNLLKVLSEKYWNSKPQWLQAEKGYEEKIKNNIAGVIIGDRAIEMANQFKYQYDLAEEWKKYTGLPFTFACWVARDTVDENTIQAFNNALKQGIGEIDSVLGLYKGKIDRAFAKDYLTENISYIFDERKKEAMERFISHIGHDVKARIFP